MAIDDEPSQASVVAQLEVFAQPQGLDDTLPRASFVVTRYTEQAGASAVDGFLGLPVGSEDPGDGRMPLPPPADPSAPPTPAPETPEEQAARVANDQVVIAQFLDAAGDLAGIRGTPTVQTMACDIDGAPTGQQVTGSVVIPIFEVADTADDAYTAITNSWKEAGMGSAGSATGRAYFGTPSTTASVQQASIRGAADGLSLTAQGRC
ncbi:hypothetical protein SAMN06295879_2422 [Agreia bicolorata]|uniref:Uncharacterized protein n=1 Tax=Agreia bicolorata TaxID=110935 RepID=A0A1T4Y7A3_9MICO|nr:hypothetical protein [Agreia bicolorata]SKA97677.1 hypothetical protein SAMN06295879_2422 [Agreia bicolorata]